MERKIQFGNVLKKLRKDRKITQVQLAEKIDVTQNAISKYESGESFPAFEILVKLADYFQISLDELVFAANPAAEAIIEENQPFINDILNDMPLEELIAKYDILVDGRKATIEEAASAVDAIRYDRYKKAKEGN